MHRQIEVQSHQVNMGSQSNLPTARGNQPPSITVSGNNTTITLPAPSDYKVIGYRTEKIVQIKYS